MPGKFRRPMSAATSPNAGTWRRSFVGPRFLGAPAVSQIRPTLTVRIRLGRMERTARTFAQIGRSLVFAVASALTLTVFASEPEPPPTAGLIPVTQCAIERGSVRSRDPEDAKSMCAGAGAAIQFFQSHGVSLDESVRIVIGEELPSGISSLAVGCFSRSDRISYVLSYEKFVARKYWLGLQVNRQLYETVASHEVAHAIASCASASTSLTTEATQYGTCQ